LSKLAGARGEQRGKWGGGSAQACHAAEGEREKEGVGGMGSTAHAHVRGGLANRGRRWGAADVARLIGGVGRQRGPVSAVGCRRERGKRGGMAVGHRQVGPVGTVPGSVVQTRF
jgi:hypothetical protein